MNEDQCRIRVKHGAEKFSRLRRIALNKLKRWEIPYGQNTQPSRKIRAALEVEKGGRSGFQPVDPLHPSDLVVICSPTQGPAQAGLRKLTRANPNA